MSFYHLTSVVLSFFCTIPAFALSNAVNVDSGDQMARSVIALQMEIQPNGSTTFYKGTGIIIGERTVLTAGHNFFFLANRASAHAILNVQPSWGEDSKGQKRIKVQAVSVYPGFKMDDHGTYDDLAVVRLSEKLPEFYKPLPLASPKLRRPIKGEHGLVAGYGMSGSAEHQQPSDLRLRDALLTVDHVTESKIWFTGEYSTIEGGDSGGPVLFQRNSRWFVYGIAVHHLYENGVALPPAAFTDVAAYRDWVDSAIRKLSM